MRFAAILFGALLLGAPQPPLTPDPQVRAGELLWLSLQETPGQVTSILGQPTLVAEFARDFLSWQYQIGDIDHHEFSHQLVFRRSGHTLISITRNYETPRRLDALFPEGETTVHQHPQAPFSLLLRRLSGGRVLLAPGVSRPSQPIAQIVLIRESELTLFYPWLPAGAGLHSAARP